jgi:5'-3' exonuclease
VFNDAEVKIKLYIDGAYHPSKAKENQERLAKVNKALQEIKDILARSDPEERPDLDGPMKRACYLRPDLVWCIKEWGRRNEVEVIGAPFEADPQLVHGELTGVTDATYSTDSDMVILGSKVFVDNLQTTASAKGACNIVEIDEVIKNSDIEHLGGGAWDLIALACFLGNDFIDRPLTQGVATIQETLMPQWALAKSEEEREAILDRIGDTLYWKKGDAETAQDYREKFKMAANMYKHPPVFVKSKDATGAAAVELAALSSVTGEDLLDDISQWPSKLGWSPPDELRKIAVNERLNTDAESMTALFTDMMHLERWSRDGRLLEDIQAGKLPGDPELPVPPGAIIDFEKWPITMLKDGMLIRWLACRRIKWIPPASHSTPYRSALEDLVNRVVALGDNAPPIQPPVKTPIGDGRYVVWDLIYTGDVVQWRGLNEDERDSLLSTIRNSVQHIDDSYIDDVFGYDHNGIRKRAELCIQGGNLDIRTLKYAIAKREDTREDVYLFSIRVTPSVKTGVYSTSIVISKEGKYLGCPYSGCECPAGNLFCSHMLAVLLLFMIIQDNNTTTFAEFLEYLPAPIISFQNIPVHNVMIY